MSNRGHIIEPKSEIPRLVVGLFGLAGLVALIIIIGLLAPDILDFLENKEVVNENRTWVTRAWTQSNPAADEVAKMAAIMQDNGIKMVYVESNAWHGGTGEFVQLPYTRTFVERFRSHSDDIKLLAWLIMDIDRLYDADARASLAEAARWAVREGGFDGVHLQVRSVPDNSQDLIGLLRDVRSAVGPQGFISVTVPPDRTPIDPDVPASPSAVEGLTWSQAFKRRVILNTNEIVLMSHASGLTTIEDYVAWTAYQVATYATIIQDLDLEVNLRYIIALPTYEAEIAHDPAVENVETALDGVFQGMARARKAGVQVDGVGLYPWETSDLLEIETYWQQWVSRDN